VLSKLPLCLALFACLLLLPGAYSVGISFSAQDGSGSVSLSSIYNLDDSVSVNEESTASFGPVGISNTRFVSGTGHIQADQSYSGSGGYTGSAKFSTLGSGSLTGSAILTPSSLSAFQNVVASGQSNAGMSVTDGGTAEVGSNIVSGSMQSSQSISTGSAHATSTTKFIGATGSNYAAASSPGQGWTKLYSTYVLHQGASAIETSSASSDPVGITDTRSVFGTGKIKASQSYSGSGGYYGSATLDAQGASGTLQGSATLTPQTLTASQDLSLAGDSVDTSMSLSNEGDSATLGVAITSGTIASRQSIQTGSVDVRILANIEAQLVLYRQLVNILSNQVNSLTTINTPTSSPVVLNAAANSYTGSNLAFEVSGGNINVDDNLKVTGPAGSEVNIETQVTNAKSCDYQYYPNSIYSRENRATLTVKDADSIFASASAGKDWMPGGQYATGGSGVSVNVDHGSLEDYSNKAYFDGTNFIASQSANSASGNLHSPYSTSVSFSQEASSAEGESVTSSLGATGYSKVNGYSSMVTSGQIGTLSNQKADFASGTWVYSSQDGANKEGDRVQGSFWNQGGSNEGSVSGYSSTVNAMRSNVDLSQKIGKTSGNIIHASSWAFNNFNIKDDESATDGQVTTYLEYNAALDGYFSSAKAQNAFSATASQNVYSASGNRVGLHGGAYKHNNNIDYSGGVIRYLDGGANSYAEIYGGSVKGYSNSVCVENGASFQWPGGFRTTSSQSINYAEGNDIAVGTQAFDQVGGERANVFTNVEKYGSGKGNIFLYTDSSKAEFPSALIIYSQTLPPLPVGETTSSADINAVGTTIDVKANADNTKDTTPAIEDGFYKPGILQSNKLSASIGIKAESHQEPVITNKEEWKGLAFMAIDSNALTIPQFPLAGQTIGPLDLGHVGVGIWNDDGTWTVGSLQGGITDDLYNLYGASLCPGELNNGWSQHGLNWQQVVTILGDNIIKIDDKQIEKYRPGSNYDKIKIIKIGDDKPDPDAVKANAVMDDYRNRGFWLVFGPFATHPTSNIFAGLLRPLYGIGIPGLNDGITATANDLLYAGDKYWPLQSNDCLDAAYEALRAYGAVEDIDWPWPSTEPNYYFDNILHGKEYSWNSDWKTYVNDSP